MANDTEFRRDLDNFEEFHGISSPFILTSPRSLRTCALLQIEPKELVYHSLEEYEESLPECALSQIYRIFEERETERQEKLLKCRQFRREMRISENSRRKERLRFINSAATTNRDSEKSTAPASASMNSETTKTSPPNSRKVRLHSAPKSKHKIHDDKENRQISMRQSQKCKNDSRTLIGYSSETESLADEKEDCRYRHCLYDRQIYSTKSMADLRGNKSNLDFNRMSCSPLSASPRICKTYTRVNDDNEILRDYMARYGDLISGVDLSRDDAKILELLVLKKGRDEERNKLAQQVRSTVENDRLKRIRETNQWHQQWQERLTDKRHRENEENLQRFLTLENKWRNNRLGLLHYLEGRDAKVQKYLEDLQYQRKRRMLEKQQNEALRQLEVGRAIDKLLEEDRQHRQATAEKLHVRMREAEMRKRRKEQDNWRHVQEMNRLEDMRRELKQEQIEIAAQKAIDELRFQLTQKEQRASQNYMNRLSARNALLSQGSGNRAKSLEKARALHAELLEGLDEWHRKVLDLQLAAQERASQNYTNEITRRRARIASERALREERSLEMLRRVREKDEKQRELALDMIETKNSRSARVKAEKERKICMSRSRAQVGAEMRQKVRETLDPETFDKKAARVELELRLLKKSGRWANPKSNIVPRVNGGKYYYRHVHCSCKCKK